MRPQRRIDILSQFAGERAFETPSRVINVRFAFLPTGLLDLVRGWLVLFGQIASLSCRRAEKSSKSESKNVESKKR